MDAKVPSQQKGWDVAVHGSLEFRAFVGERSRMSAADVVAHN
jgi:hypothetical protein